MLRCAHRGHARVVENSAEDGAQTIAIVELFVELFVVVVEFVERKWKFVLVVELIEFVLLVLVLV